MPIYIYRCKHCGRKFEFLKVKHSEKPSCPECNSTDLEKQMTAAGIIRSGSNGPKDMTCCGRGERCSTPPCSDSGVCHRD